MTSGARQPDNHDEGSWEVDETVVRRPLGAVVSVRFEPEAARRVRRCAVSLGLSLSEFVRRATLMAIEWPAGMARMKETGLGPSPHVAAPTTGNITWRLGENGQILFSQSTFGTSPRQPLQDEIGNMPPTCTYPCLQPA